MTRPSLAISMMCVASLAITACPSSTPPAVAPAPASSTSVAPTTTSAAPVASSSTEVPTEVPPGAAVKAPIFSDDDCSKDDECSGVRTCHPDKCVALKNVGTMAPGMMCTMDCRGGTLDCNFNHCGCAANSAGKKKCAVLPGPAPAH